MSKFTYHIEDQDRLSKLSDEILCHILSFLPRKDAVATSVLSTRWKSLWTMVPVIDFVRDPEKVAVVFFPVVNKFVRHRKTASATRVRIKNLFEIWHPAQVDTWVSTAVDGNVEHLELSLWCDSKFEWPENLFMCGTLVTLKLRGVFVLSVPSRVNLQSLKTLHLTVNYSENNDSVARLLTGCPALEVFRVKLVDCFDESFQIYVPSLKHLSIKSIRNSTVRKLEINTPFLQSFEVRGCHHVQEYVLGDLTNVVDANIDVHYPTELDDDATMEMFENLNVIGAIFKLLRALSNVQSLSIGDFTYETMMVDPSAINALSQYDHLVRLQLRYGLKFLYSEELLGKCPRLKELIIDKDCCFSGPYWEPVEPSKTIPDCISSQLTLFEHRRYNENDLPLTTYILNCAKVLKVVKIQTDRYRSGLQQKFQMLQQITKLPRKSRECVIEFE